MIAMQYCFTLPADYDMDIVERRIKQNGWRLDGFSGLIFKAFLFSRLDAIDIVAKENRYAPFYLWRDAESIQCFLQSQGFAALIRDFGWPQINSWLVMNAPACNEIKNAHYMSVKVQSIRPHSDLMALKPQGKLCAWDISRWQLLTADFGDGITSFTDSDSDKYRIGYLASEEKF